MVAYEQKKKNDLKEMNFINNIFMIIHEFFNRLTIVYHIRLITVFYNIHNRTIFSTVLILILATSFLINPTSITHCADIADGTTIELINTPVTPNTEFTLRVELPSPPPDVVVKSSIIRKNDFIFKVYDKPQGPVVQCSFQASGEDIAKVATEVAESLWENKWKILGGCCVFILGCWIVGNNADPE
jgi:hypothetical protein